MTTLIITDIRKSGTGSNFDLITAIMISRQSFDDCNFYPNSDYELDSLLVLESATAEKEIASVGAKRGDQYFRMLAPPNHMLKVGDKMHFDDKL